MTEKRLTANRRNALKSTGPRTPEGKARTALNALKHGLRASSLAVPILENAEDWETHQDLVARDLSPVGYLETVLSERVAAILWRLGRVVRYESATVSSAIHSAGENSHHEAGEDPVKAKKRAETLSRVRSLKPKAQVTGEEVGIVLDFVSEAVEVDLSEDEKAEAVVCPEDFPGGYFGDWNGWTRESLEKAVLSIKAQAAEDYASTDPWEDAAKEAELAATLAL